MHSHAMYACGGQRTNCRSQSLSTLCVPEIKLISLSCHPSIYLAYSLGNVYLMNGLAVITCPLHWDTGGHCRQIKASLFYCTVESWTQDLMCARKAPSHHWATFSGLKVSIPLRWLGSPAVTEWRVFHGSLVLKFSEKTILGRAADAGEMVQLHTYLRRLLWGADVLTNVAWHMEGPPVCAITEVSEPARVREFIILDATSLPRTFCRSLNVLVLQYLFIYGVLRWGLAM